MKLNFFFKKILKKSKCANDSTPCTKHIQFNQAITKGAQPTLLAMHSKERSIFVQQKPNRLAGCTQVHIHTREGGEDDFNLKDTIVTQSHCACSAHKTPMPVQHTRRRVASKLVPCPASEQGRPPRCVEQKQTQVL